MAVRIRLDPIDRDIDLLISQDLTPENQSRLFASFAREEIDKAKAINRRALGREPKVRVTVNGSEDPSLSSVPPTGIIIAEFEILLDALGWINTQLQIHSPVKSGLYAKSHELFGDGEHITNPNNPPPAAEYVFLNVQPYARKIERGQSSQAPDGVYQAVARLASGKFGNSASITFSYRSALGFSSLSGWANSPSAMRHAAAHGRRSDASEWLTRQPAIIVRPR
jgi:hypothetical protein